MRAAGPLFAVALAIASAGIHAAPPPTPVIVELFTSEGCVDCPPADTLLEKLLATQPVAGAEIIGLGEHVDYWDRLGWKDRFSSPAVTNRQRQYQTRFGTESLYTPQMVVDGRAEFVGSDASAARKAIEKTLAAPHGVVKVDVARPLQTSSPQGDVTVVHVSVTASDLPAMPRGDRGDLVLLLTESGLTTDVKRGENHGKVLTHAPVVRILTTIGHVDGGATSLSATADVPLDRLWQRDHLAFVAFVQQVRDRTILASASVPAINVRP
jgi:hypothetical protein